VWLSALGADWGVGSGDAGSSTLPRPDAGSMLGLPYHSIACWSFGATCALTYVARHPRAIVRSAASVVSVFDRPFASPRQPAR